jgi:hypothetical protein
MDFTQIFLENWQYIFVCLGPGLAIGKMIDLILANTRHKKWADIGEKIGGMFISMLMGIVLLKGLDIGLEAVLLVVSFSLLAHAGFINVSSYLKKGAKEKAAK